MSEPTPVISPLLALLRSRKFIAALVAFLVSLFLYGFPQFEPFREIGTAFVGALAFAVIGGIAYEDAKKAGVELSIEPAETVEEDLRDIIEVVLDELLTKRADGDKTV